MQRTPMTVSQASEYTGYAKAYLYSLIRKRKIPYYKGEGVRGKVIFAKEELDDFIFSHRVATEEEVQAMASKAVAR